MFSYRILTFTLIVLHIVTNCIFYGKLNDGSKTSSSPKRKMSVIFADFEAFEHNLNETIEELCKFDETLKFYIVTYDPLFPALNLQRSVKCDVSMLTTRQDATKSYSQTRIETQIDSELIMLAVDNFRISKAIYHKLTNLAENNQKIVAIPLVEHEYCYLLEANPGNWTLVYHNQPDLTNCDFRDGESLFVMKSALFQSLNQPIKRPISESICIQAKLLNTEVQFELLKGIELQPRQEASLPKRLSYKTQRTAQLYRDFQFKKVVKANKGVEFYGCSKSTPRCYGSLANDVPDYLFARKWTPPCCLEHLRETARHVFKVLEAYNIRYWLEGGSLLGAVRNGDIIPWDNDVDIGVYKDDMKKLVVFESCIQGPVVDELGFLWEKALEGDFFRVHFSEVNRVHVDIFPFYSLNGTMTKDTWFETHKQDCTFPERFLMPLERIQFINATPFAPNHQREFLEFKFGKGVIENPVYPGHLGLDFPETLQIT